LRVPWLPSSVLLPSDDVLRRTSGVGMPAGALSSTQPASERTGQRYTMNRIRRLHHFLYNHGRPGRILELILILAFFVALLIPLWLWVAYQVLTMFPINGAP
jgi:hypothetical protein